MVFSRIASVVAACAVLQAEAGLHVATWKKYPGYTGSLTVAGGLGIGQTGDKTLLLAYRLSGTDVACNGTDNGKANTCGVHVHSGTSCDKHEDVGGHYYVGGSDPWGAAQYQASSSGEAMLTNQFVSAGTTLAQNKGKAFVVHDADGVRIACGILVEDTVTTGTASKYAEKYSKYPGYTGALVVAGSVVIKQNDFPYSTPVGKATTLEFSLTGVDKECKKGADLSKANACGIHVHVGPCTEAGGHYFDVQNDPWGQVMYFADSAGKTGASITSLIETGTTTASLANRSIVVHDLTGARVGCSDITDAAKTNTVISGAPGMTTIAAWAAAVVGAAFAA